MDFRPPIMEGAPSVLINAIAEESIVEAMTQQTSSGLRIIRYLMSKMVSHGLPDFHDPETIRLLARRFIQDVGSGKQALELMNALK